MNRKTTKPKGSIAKRQSDDAGGATYDPALCERVMDLGRKGRSPVVYRYTTFQSPDAFSGEVVWLAYPIIKTTAKCIIINMPRRETGGERFPDEPLTLTLNAPTPGHAKGITVPTPGSRARL